MPGTFVYTPAAGTVLVGRGGADAVGDLHADRHRELHDRDADGDDHRASRRPRSITWAAPADIVYGTALSATQLNATAPVPGTFVYTPPATTVLTAGAAQSLSVTFTPTDAANYTTATKTVDDQRREGDPVDHLGAAGGHRLRDRAERDAAERDRPRSPARSSTRRAGDDGPDRGRGAEPVGDLHADRRGELHHRDEDGRRSTSPRRRRSITWSAPADIVYGTALSATQLNATANVPGTFVYTPVAGTVLNAGAAQTLSVTFTPTDAANYTIATKTVAITVAEGDHRSSPGRAPADIIYGTALSATQLNATTTVPGTFVYTPPVTTVLSAGTAQNLSVTFTPTDGGQLHDGNQDSGDQCPQGDPGHHLVGARGHRLRHRAERDAAERDDDGTRHLRLHAAGDDGPVRGSGAEPVGDLHADRRGQLHERDEDGRDQCPQGDPGHHLVGARGHRLRHRPERDPAECDHDRGWYVCLHPRRRRGALRRRGTDALDDLHTD